MNPADAPIMILALTSPTRAPDQIYDAVSNIAAEAVAGAGRGQCGTGRRVPACASRSTRCSWRASISLEDVRTALQSASANRPRGVLEGIDIRRANGLADLFQPGRAEGQRLCADDRLAQQCAGPPVRHRARGGWPEELHTMGLFNGQKAVPIIITRQPDANIVETVDALKAQVPDLQKLLPADIKLAIATDRTITIRASLHEVEITLLVSTLLVVLVVSLFLQSWRATAIPAAAVIVSLLGTVGVMYLSGFLLDNLSADGADRGHRLCGGRCHRGGGKYRPPCGRGHGPLPAALKGAREVGFTVLSISLSLVAVFVPLIFMGGIMGRLMREFALTMTAAVAISLIASLTVTPMLAGRAGCPWHRARWGTNRQPPVPRLAPLLTAWRPPARLGAGASRAGAAAAVGAVVLNVPDRGGAQGLLPTQDTGSMMGGRVDQSMSFNATADKMTRRPYREGRPAVATMVALPGAAGRDRASCSSR
jgi:multidrug efflux pump